MASSDMRELKAHIMQVRAVRCSLGLTLDLLQSTPHAPPLSCPTTCVRAPCENPLGHITGRSQSSV
jgi:hypothetical protein